MNKTAVADPSFYVCVARRQAGSLPNSGRGGTYWHFLCSHLGWHVFLRRNKPMALQSLKEFAAALAVYARRKLEDVHRGALLIRCIGDGNMIAAVFGNDNYR